MVGGGALSVERRTASIYQFIKSRYDVAVNDGSVEHLWVIERPRMEENDAHNRRGLPASCSIKFSQYRISFSLSTAYICRRHLVQAPDLPAQITILSIHPRGERSST